MAIDLHAPSPLPLYVRVASVLRERIGTGEWPRGLRPNGRHLIVGYASGDIPQIPANYILLKQVAVIGVSFRQCAQQAPAVARAGIRALIDMWRAGKLHPRVSVVHPLEEFDEALAALSSRNAIGKHLVRVDRHLE